MTDPINIIDTPGTLEVQDWELYIEQLRKMPDTAQVREELLEAVEMLAQIRAGAFDIERAARINAGEAGGEA